MLRRVALVRTDVSEQLSASFIRVTRISELGTLAVTSNRRTLRRNTSQFVCSRIRPKHVECLRREFNTIHPSLGTAHMLASVSTGS
jgi:hypothetical protein